MVYDITTNIARLREKTLHLQNDKLTTSDGGEWSIKKLLALDYYFPAFKTICSPKNKFNEWYYVDPFCGSGLIKLHEKEIQDEKFPGSSLVGAFAATENNYTDCILSDGKLQSINDLKVRIDNCKNQLSNRTFDVQNIEFEHAVAALEQKKRFGKAFLVFIDPTGYIPIKWSLMDRILKGKMGVVDLIFNFFTSAIAQNASAARTTGHQSQGLTEFFGDEGWKNRTTEDALLDYYCQKIASYGKHVEVIGVYTEGKSRLYDLILATKSEGGENVIRDLKSIMERTTTKDIRTAYKVILKKQSTLPDF